MKFLVKIPDELVNQYFAQDKPSDLVEDILRRFFDGCGFEDELDEIQALKL